MFAGSNSCHLACLVGASLAWHKILNLDQDWPLHCGLFGEIKVPIHQVTGPLSSTGGLTDSRLFDWMQRLENLVLLLEKTNSRNIERSVAFALAESHYSNPTTKTPQSFSSPTSSPTILVQPALLTAFRNFLYDTTTSFQT